MIKITKKTKVSPAMWVMKCPRCERWCASAAEKGWLPDVAVCYCDEKKGQS